MSAASPTRLAEEVDPLALLGIDYVELFVGSARQASYYLSRAYGFKVTCYRGLETSSRDRVSYVLESGEVRLVVTGALGPESDVADNVRLHGDGVRNIAFLVEDAEKAYEEALKRGAKAARHPQVMEDEDGRVVRAAIRVYGDTHHTFVERRDYDGPFLPGYQAHTPLPDDDPPTNIAAFDHIVANVEEGRMDHWVEFYRRVLGFDQLVHFSDEQISSDYSALMSKVMWDGSKIRLPINEPAEGRRRSQIEEYLDFYRGPGVQHLALLTEDVVAAVSALRRRGVEFIRVPDGYYDDLKERMQDLDVDVERLRELGVLMDRDDEGYLLQIFTKPFSDRPTLFFELIERHGSRGFGAGNFKALFLALEREQAERGNL